MANVKCVICGKMLDYSKEQAVKSNKHKRRYSHLACEPDGELIPLPPPKEKKTKVSENKEILDMVKQIFGDKANYPLIQKQIKRFKTELKYTSSGITKTLNYYYVIKKNSPDIGHGGIGIVETEYPRAMDYYYSLYLAKIANEDKDIFTIVNKVKEIEIEIPQPAPAKIKLFDLGEE